MRSKVVEKKLVRKLRIKGLSLLSISKRIGVAKSSCSLWCKDILLTTEQQKLLRKRADASKKGALANKLKRQIELRNIEKKAITNFERFKASQIKRLKDIGTIIYWAEGAKKDMVDITNSDPEMIKLVMLWLRKICQVKEDRFRVNVFYHSGQNENEIKKYWSKITNISLLQFNKSIWKKEGTGHRKNILNMGTCKIRVHDRNLLHTILTWIKQLYLVL